MKQFEIRFISHKFEKSKLYKTPVLVIYKYDVKILPKIPLVNPPKLLHDVMTAYIVPYKYYLPSKFLGQILLA